MSQPTRLGRYPVRRRLGAGAFATVWLAHDEELDSAVAIKVLADNWAGDAHVRRRFVEEGRFLRKVESPHVVPVYDAGELDDGRPFLVMAYADRGTLAERLADGPLPRGEALRVLGEVGAGLTALHTRGVLHRDVKPGNVLLREHDGGERAMLADLGLGKELDVSSRLTVIGGTPSYVAPEQARGEGLDARADLFSLAALAYLLLAGRPAWSHQSLGAAADPPPVPAMGDTVPRALADVVERGLAADRDDRQASVEELVAELRRAATDDDLTLTLRQRTAEEPEPPPESRRPVRALALAVAGLLAGAAVGWGAAAARGGDVRLEDASGAVAVTVPSAWTDAVADGAWTPPEGEVSFPALAAGTGGEWRTSGTGVFAGLLDGDDLPGELPGHPECGTPARPSRSGEPGAEEMTAVHRDCPGEAPVVLEHLAQVGDDRQLWVQVRGDDVATVRRVLDSVELRGS